MKFCNLNYIKSISPGNPKFVTEIIQTFLKQVPVSIEEMNNCLGNADWSGLQYNAHKIVSHFDCMGISKEYTGAAEQIEKNAKLHEHFDLIPSLLLKLENAFQKACKELDAELNKNAL